MTGETADATAGAEVADKPAAAVAEAADKVCPLDPPAHAAAPATAAPAADAPAPAEAVAPAKEKEKEEAPVPAEEAAAETKKAAAPAAEEKAVEEVVVEPPADDSTYGLFVEPAASFGVAREIMRQLHKTLTDLKGVEVEASGELADSSGFSKISQELQLQLLALRRSHRAMAKSAEAGKAAEVNARRLADAEHAYLETKKYESACFRAAACYCRCLPTPQLSELRPFLGGPASLDAEQEEEAEDAAAAAPSAAAAEAAEAAAVAGAETTSLAKRLEVEHEERARLAGELDGLARQRSADVDAFVETQNFSGDLAAKLLSAEVALEPVCDLLELRPRKRGAPSASATLAHVPTPLRLLYSKFEVLASFGAAAGISVELEGCGADASGSEPPAKKARSVDGKIVRVLVDKAVSLRFSCADAAVGDGSADAAPAAPIVGVSCVGGVGDSLLENLWPGDDGTSGALAIAATAAGVTGRAYGWAQVLAGLRSTTTVLLDGTPSSALAGPLADGGAVVASEVVRRLRAKLPKGKSKA